MRRPVLALVGLLPLLLLAPPAHTSPATDQATTTRARSWARVVVADGHGHILWKSRRYGPASMGRVIRTTIPHTMSPMGSDSGTAPEQGNPEKIGVEQSQRSSLGSLEFDYTIWTKWHWDNLPPVHKVWVDYVDQTFDTGSAWQWGGVKKKVLGHYAWLTGYPKSGYKHYRKAEFSGPALGGTGVYTKYDYPENWLYSHSDGGFWWKWSCC